MTVDCDCRRPPGVVVCKPRFGRRDRAVHVADDGRGGCVRHRHVEGGSEPVGDRSGHARDRVPERRTADRRLAGHRSNLGRGRHLSARDRREGRSGLHRVAGVRHVVTSREGRAQRRRWSDVEAGYERDADHARCECAGHGRVSGDRDRRRQPRRDLRDLARRRVHLDRRARPRSRVGARARGQQRWGCDVHPDRAACDDRCRLLRRRDLAGLGERYVSSDASSHPASSRPVARSRAGA